MGPRAANTSHWCPTRHQKSDCPTPRGLLPVFVIMALFALMAWRDSQGIMLYPPTPEPACNCETDSYDCGDFTTHDEAQDGFDYCGVMMRAGWMRTETGWRVRGWTDGECRESAD